MSTYLAHRTYRKRRSEIEAIRRKQKNSLGGCEAIAIFRKIRKRQSMPGDRLARVSGQGSLGLGPLHMPRIGGCSTSGFSRKSLLFSGSPVRWPGVYPDSDPVAKPCPKVHTLQSLSYTNDGLSSKTNTMSWPSKSTRPGPEGPTWNRCARGKRGSCSKSTPS